MKTRRMNNNVLEICDESNNVILSVAESIENNSFIIKFSGQLRNEVAHEFEDELMAALSVCHKIILDCENITYIASMAMKALLSIQQIIDGIDDAAMTLVKVTPEVMATMKESGFSDILNIEE